MPTYEYECPACGHRFEEFKDMCSAEEDLQKCPECETRARRKIGAGTAVIFYGPGFYGTDYRSIKDAQHPETVKRRKRKERISVAVTDRRGKKKKKK